MNVREVIEGWSLLRRVRGVFLLYALFCVLSPFAQVVGADRLAGWQRVLLACSLLALSGWWVFGWRRGRFVRVLEPVEWLVIGAVIVYGDTGDPATNLIFGAMTFRVYYGNRWDWLRRLVYLEAVILLTPPIGRLLTPDFAGPPPNIAIAIPILATLMFVLKNALSQHERMVTRERLLAQGAGAVVAATDRQLIYLTAVRTALGLAGAEPGLRTTLAEGQGMTTRILAAAGDHTDGLVGLEVHLDRMPPTLLDAFRDGDPIYLEGDECAVMNGIADTEVCQGGLFLVPLRSGNHRLGTLSIGAERPLRPEIRSSLVTWAAQVASSLETLQLNEELTKRAFHDALTGLPNRALVHDRLRMALNARLDGRQVGFMLIDLDGFKQVNDVHGHKAGDELLCEVSRRLVGCVRQGDTVGRLGGDEFAVILPGIPGNDQAITVAERLVQAVRAPITADGQPVVVGASVGLAFADEHTSGDLDELIRRADTAMYSVKATRQGGYAIYGASTVSA